jgi:predicted PP-loop superfamily ATPase
LRGFFAPCFDTRCAEKQLRKAASITFSGGVDMANVYIVLNIVFNANQINAILPNLQTHVNARNFWTDNKVIFTHHYRTEISQQVGALAVMGKLYRYIRKSIFS